MVLPHYENLSRSLTAGNVDDVSQIKMLERRYYKFAASN
jgi:hypothetical protein